MTRRLMMTMGLATLLAFAAPLAAHDDYRFIGTVVRIPAGKLDVKQTKDGKIISMKTDSATIVTRDKKKVANSELRVGANVVVDARGDSLQDLLVLEVKLVPAPTTK
jgi:hypothetical protein